MSDTVTKVGFTPGEWKVDVAETTARWHVIYVDDEDWDGGKREIAEITDVFEVREHGKWVRTDDADKAEANVRLLRASPELYELLKVARNYIPTSSNGYGSLAAKENARNLAVKIDAVLAKVDGAA